jgi:predicted permease
MGCFMDAFIYSLNSTVPIFLTMIVGWLIKRLGIINDEFANKANKYVFKVALPLLC